LALVKAETGSTVRRGKIDRRVVIAALVYLGVGLAVSAGFATWNDEEYTLATTSHGVAYAFTRAINYELQAPLYFSALAAWRALDHSVWFARLFSLLCATGFFLSLIAVGRRIAPGRDPLPFAAIVALNPYVAYAAFEIRLYALSLVLSALMWIAFDAGYFSDENDTRARWYFVAVAIVGVYVQYFLAFLVAGFACSLAVAGKWQTLRTYLAHAAVVALAAIPLALVLRGQFGSDADASLPAQVLLRAEASSTIGFLFPYDPAWWWLMDHARAVYLCVAGASVVLLVLAKPRLSRTVLAYCACALAVLALYAIAIVVLSLDLSTRHFVAAFLPLAVAVYALFEATSHSPNLRKLAFLPTIALTIAVLISRYRFLAQVEDWKRVAPFLAANVVAGDVIAIYPADAEPAFEREYHGNAPYVPWPRPYSTVRYSPTVSGIKSEAEARAAFAKLSRYRHIWFVDDVECLAVPRLGCDIVKDVVHSDFKIDLERQFYQSTVYELSDFASEHSNAQGLR
jgi:hypothetical protein